MALAHILLVDDDIPFVKTITKRLDKRGYAIDFACSGLEAIEKMAANGSRVEVVILDVKMPGMDGVETLFELKRKFPLTEVIMLTGHATVGSAIEGMKKGAFDYLMKPCDEDSLISKVSEAVARKRQHENKIIEARMREITARLA